MNLDEAFLIFSNRRSLGDRWLDRPDAEAQFAEACRVVAATAPWQVIPRLAEKMAFPVSDHTGKLAEIFMAQALRLPPELWPRMDQQIRTLLPFGIHWNAGKDRDATAAAWLLIALCDPSGRVRERAIGATPALPPVLACALLLTRVNDWAYPIRKAASAALAARLPHLGEASRLQLVPLVRHLSEDCGRHRHDGGGELMTWWQMLAEGLDETLWRELWEKAADRGKETYLALFKASGKIPDAGTRALLLRGNHRASLLWLLREVSPLLAPEEKETLLSSFNRSRSPVVKREWLLLRLEEGGTDLVPDLENALLDHARALRQLARFHLAKLEPGKRDFTSFYQERLRIPELETVALAGLAEASPAEGHREAVARLRSTQAAVKKAAIRSLSKEALGDQLEYLMDAMADPTPGVAKAARQRLSEITLVVGVELLARPGHLEHLGPEQKLNYLRMAPLFQKWDALEFILPFTTDPTLREEAWFALKRWRNRALCRFSKLPHARRERLIEKITSSGLDEREREAFLFLVERAE